MKLHTYDVSVGAWNQRDVVGFPFEEKQALFCLLVLQSLNVAGS